MDAIPTSDSQPISAPAQSTADALQRVTGRRKRPRGPFKIVDTYLFAQIVEATLRGLLMFVMLLLFFGVMASVRRLLDNQANFAGAMQLIGLQLPRILLFTLPMSVLYGTLHAFLDLSSRGEIVAMGAGGMSFGRMLRAPLLWAMMLSIFAFWLQERVVPPAERLKDQVIAKLITDGAPLQSNIEFKDEQPDGSSRLVRAESFDPRTRILVQPRVTSFDKRQMFTSQISAERARWDTQSEQWSFYNGRYVGQADDAQRKDYDSADGRFRYLSAEAPNPSQLSKRALTRAENLKKGNFEFLSIADLRDWIATIDLKTADTTTPQVERERLGKLKSGAIFGIHDKIATPLICISLVLIGLPFGLRPQRSSGGFSMGLSLIILMFYYVVWTMVTQIGKAGSINPYLAAYFPITATTIVGAFLMGRKMR